MDSKSRASKPSKTASRASRASTVYSHGSRLPSPKSSDGSSDFLSSGSDTPGHQPSHLCSSGYPLNSATSSKYSSSPYFSPTQPRPEDFFSSHASETYCQTPTPLSRGLRSYGGNHSLFFQYPSTSGQHDFPISSSSPLFFNAQQTSAFASTERFGTPSQSSIRSGDLRSFSALSESSSFNLSSPSPWPRQRISASKSPSLPVMAGAPPLFRSTPPVLSESQRSETARHNIWSNYDRPNIERGTTSDPDMLNEVIMALDMDKDGRVGCAFYIVADETLFIEEDTAMGGIEAVETVVFRVQPTTILIPNRAPSTLVELLEKDAQRIDEDRSNSALQGSHILRHLSAAHFDYDASKEALVRIDSESSVPDPVEVLPAQEDAAAHCFNSSNHSKLMHLAESVNLDSHTSIGCAGAVLGDLARRRTAECLAPDADAPISFQVRSIKMNTPKSSLIVSADALISLQIMRSEHHPNPQVQNASTLEPNAKERLSICALLQALAGTAEGKANIRQMLFRPTTDLGLIRERQRTIAVLLRPENNEAVEAIRKQLQKIKNVRAPLLRVKKGTDRLRGQLSIRLGDWRALLRFTMVSTRLKEAIMSLEGGVEVTIFSKIYHNIDSQCILTIGEMIMNTIDFKLSKDVGHTEIFPGASERLDELKQEFGEVYHMLPNIKEGIEREVPRWAARCIQHCTIFPELGFLLAVILDPKTGRGVYDGRDIEGDDWEVIFVKDDMVYYKTHVMRILDEQYGDLPSRIIEEEIHIIMELSAVVMEYEAVLVKASVLLGELDSLLALALAAEKHQWTAPQMTDKNIMDIKDGRHPLQELVVSSFIPNDCNLTGGPGARGSGQSRVSMNDNETQPCMLILTGPNNSGKSIYMKQVAIIVHLAHIGSYVPATSATIGVTDRILTRIATRESGVDDESAFLIDLKQMAFSMNFATRRSLILIDEFGKGTTAETGAALLAAVLVNFLHFGVNRPKILVGTHFHELFTTGLIKAESGVALAHMDFRMNADAQDPQDYITFLFRLVSGRGTSSLGTMCAAINGVEREVVERAADLVLMQSRNEDLEEAFRDDTDEDVEELRKAELIARRFLAVDVSELGEAKDIRELLRNILSVDDEDRNWEKDDVYMEL